MIVVMNFNFGTDLIGFTVLHIISLCWFMLNQSLVDIITSQDMVVGRIILGPVQSKA
jgi:hypothetical protein